MTIIIINMNHYTVIHTLSTQSIYLLQYVQTRSKMEKDSDTDLGLEIDQIELE